MKCKREVRTKVWGTSWALLRILHLHWQRGTQRGLSLGDWQNQHWYWEQKETDEFREKETWQEAPCCLPLMLLKSASSSISSILLSTRSKFSIEKISFPDILTPFFLLCYLSVSNLSLLLEPLKSDLVINTFCYPVSKGLQWPLDRPNILSTVLILLAFCAVFDAVDLSCI